MAGHISPLPSVHGIDFRQSASVIEKRDARWRPSLSTQVGRRAVVARLRLRSAVPEIATESLDDAGATDNVLLLGPSRVSVHLVGCAVVLGA